MELTPKEKGNLTELQCLMAFAEQGLKVSIPYGENCRYDFVLDIKGTLFKIQCKTSHLIASKDGFEFKCYSTNSTRKGNYETRYSKEDIDYFATYFNGYCYLVPVEECGASKTLRFKYPKNGQKRGISLSQHYLLEEVIKQFE
jgi:hypothetical protein